MKELINNGRKIIYTDIEEVTPENVVDILNQALIIHSDNAQDIDYLWNYYKGSQPILHRVKNVNSDITNMIVENHANEIVSFKTGYLLQNPIQYVAREDGVEEEVSKLNQYVFAEDKASKDKEMADWMHICGLGYRMILPDTRINNPREEGVPFEIYTLDPRFTFVVYSSGVGHKPILAVTYTVDSNDFQTKHLYAYSDKYYFEFTDQRLEVFEKHIMKAIPIIEYPLNEERMGAFEFVLPLLDAINQTASDRQDGLDQWIQALLVFKNVDISAEDYKQIRELGGLKISDISPDRKADVKYIAQELDQGATQTLIDHQYKTVLRICGVPLMSMSGAGSSDNGVAVELRDGWSQAEYRAKSTELEWRKSEKQALRLFLNICRSAKIINANPIDIEIRFDRWNHTNLLVKSQVLTTMLGNDKIHPRLAFQASDMFIDPELAYQESMEWYENHMPQEENKQEENTQGENNAKNIEQELN